MVEQSWKRKKILNPPGKFSINFLKMENGYVATTLEKFPRARERGTL